MDNQIASKAAVLRTTDLFHVELANDTDRQKRTSYKEIKDMSEFSKVANNQLIFFNISFLVEADSGFEDFIKCIDYAISKNQKNIMFSNCFIDLFRFNHIANGSIDRISFEKCDFGMVGAHFEPEGFDCFFNGCVFNNPCDFRSINGIDKLIFSKSLFFQNSKFLMEVHFSRIQFKSLIAFESCHFEDKLLFNKLEFFNDALFHKNIFKNSVYLNAKFNNRSEFSHSIFEQSVDFIETRFENEAIFLGVNFQDDASFKQKTYFGYKPSFDFASFSKNVYLNEAIFESGINLEATHFGGDVNFFGVKGLDAKASKQNTTQETYRIIKYNFQKIGNQIESNKYFALELEKRYEELKSDKWKNLPDLIVFWFHKWSSNFGMSWLLALWWMFVLGLSITIDLNWNQNIQISYDSIKSFTKQTFHYMYILSSADDDPINNYLWFVLYKVALGYLYYQFISAVRKDTKK